MDKRLKYLGGEIGISSDEINLMPESNQEGIVSLPEGLVEGENVIVSGVNAVISAGSNVTVQDGFVFLDGEMLKVDAAIVDSTLGDLYQFEKVSTVDSLEGERKFRDGTTKNIYEINRAVPVNVSSITGLSVEGDDILTKLKSKIRVQPDYTQADNTQPDYIKNKPAILNTLLQGKVNGINVGSGGSVGTVEGGITSATVLNSPSSDLRIRVNFSNIGTTVYHPIITLLSNSADWDQDNDVYCSVKNLTATSFEILFREDVDNNQDISTLITIIPLTL